MSIDVCWLLVTLAVEIRVGLIVGRVKGSALWIYSYVTDKFC